MAGITQWFKDTASSVYASVQSLYTTTVNVVSTVGTVAYAVGSIIADHSFRRGLADWLTQSWDGFSRVLSPRNFLSLIGRPATARVWLSAHAGLFLRAAPFLAYRYAARPLASAAVKATISENPWVESLVMLPLDAAAWTLVVKNYGTNFVDTKTQNMNIAKAGANDTQLEPDAKTDNALMKPCEHGKQAIAVGTAKSIVHYGGSWLALRMLSSLVSYGEIVTLPWLMILIGDGFMETAGENCEDCQRKLIISNNPHALGTGLAFLSTKAMLQYFLESRAGISSTVYWEHPLGKFWEYFLGRYTGLNGFFIDTVLSSILTLHFIMATNLTRQTPFPGTKPGVDWFKTPRRVTDVVVAETASDIAKLCSGPAQGDFYQDGTAAARDILNKKAIRILCLLFVDQSFQDWKTFAERPAMKLFFELYGEVILGAIDYIRTERANNIHKNVDSYNQWATNKDENEFFLKSVAKSLTKTLINAAVSEDDQKILGILMMKEFEKPLDDWYDYISLHTRSASVKKHENVEVIENYGDDGEAVAAAEKREPGFYRVKDLAGAPVNALPPQDIEVQMAKKLIQLAKQDQVPAAPGAQHRPPPPSVAAPAIPKIGFFADAMKKKPRAPGPNPMAANTDKTAQDLARLLQNPK